MMTRRPDLLVLALVVVAVAAATLADPRPEQVAATPGWKAVAASGRVEARVDAVLEWSPIRRGERVAVSSLVRTGPRSRATLVRGRSFVLLDPQSEVVLPASPAPDRPSTVFQASGSVIYHVDGARQEGFRVETPYLVAGVKGTEFLVSVQGGRASVTVREGTVEVTAGRTGERHEVRAGETLLVRDDAEAEVIERVDRRGEAAEGSAVASGDARHLAWKQARRLDEARREVAYLLDGKMLRELETTDKTAVVADAGLLEGTLRLDGEDLTKLGADDLERQVLEEAKLDALAEDLTNDPDPPPAPTP